MKNEKTVQIPFKSFLTMFKLLEGIEVPQDEINALQSILEGKMDALARREAYTQYKTADTAEDRETARKKYLDTVGIPKDFRW